jgi:hypothetical protein
VTSGSLDCRVAVIGAGPYGLAVASHLRAAGVEVRTFGRVMDFWDRHMPAGMLVRSPWAGTHIADPHCSLTLDKYEAVQGARLARPLPREDFVRYGQWFQRQCVPELDGRHVARVGRAGDAFQVTLEDGTPVGAWAVVVAAGIAAFTHYPAPLEAFPPELVSHTGEPSNHNLGRFAGRRVIVIGGGQSAIESAALLHEAAADVMVLVRQKRVRWLWHGSPLHSWLHGSWLHGDCNPFREILYPPGDVGPPGINWLVEIPHLFRRLPRRLQNCMAARAIRPAATGWLRPRTATIPIRTGRHIVAAALQGGQVRLKLDDCSECCADHVLLGTGYQVAVPRYRFLSPELVRAVRTVNEYPVLKRQFESSVPRLYFVSAAAAYSFGPICRFVAGTSFTARILTQSVAKRSPG